MNSTLLLLPILIPLAAAVIVLGIRRFSTAAGAVALIFTALNLAVTLRLFGQEAYFTGGSAGFGIDFILRLYHFNSLILAAVAFFGFLIALYCQRFLKEKAYAGRFYVYMLASIFCVNGAVLSDNLILFLFFWEGLLITLYTMIALGRAEAYKTAIKAFIIVGVSDLCLMAGLGLTAAIAGTTTLSQIHLALTPASCAACILLIIGAIAKSGSAPFHTWIPDAAVDAPLPFMAFMPASLEKLLGIYFLIRITLDMFAVVPHSSISTLLMSVGAVTIIVAVMMALIQKDYKRLLAYHAVSQVGYMVLGIGTALPIGILGGIFHMLNNSLYKAGLFLTAGAVERQAATTDLARLGGLRRNMPVTCVCFLVTACAISGVPPFNGFFSKELVYAAALERGRIFYLAAVTGSLFTALSFLKLGHAVFFGALPQERQAAKEAPASMLLPMIVIASLCVVLGLGNKSAVEQILAPILSAGAVGHSGGHGMLVLITVAVLVIAVLSHLRQAKIQGGGLKAAAYIYQAPILATIFRWAQRRFFDPYYVVAKILRAGAWILYGCDRLVNWFSDGAVVGVARISGSVIRKAHDGNYATYVAWVLAGTALVVILFITRG